MAKNLQQIMNQARQVTKDSIGTRRRLVLPVAMKLGPGRNAITVERNDDEVVFTLVMCVSTGLAKKVQIAYGSFSLNNEQREEMLEKIQKMVSCDELSICQINCSAIDSVDIKQTHSFLRQIQSRIKQVEEVKQYKIFSEESPVL